MLWILKLLQSIRRQKRRFFGESLPHWLKDALAIGGYLNFLQLLPTFAAMALSPAHFYRRLPQGIRNKNSIHLTPVKFLSTSVTLVAIILFYFTSDLLAEYEISNESTLAKHLLLACILAPLIMPIVALLLRVIITLISSMPGVPSSGPSELKIGLLIPLSPWTYTRLNFGHYLWSMFYFSIYFYIGLQIFQLLGFYLFDYSGSIISMIVRKLDKCLSHIDELTALSGGNLSEEKISEYLSICRRVDHDATARAIVMQSLYGAIALIVVLLGYVMLINPYIQLLRSAVKLPTKRMHRIDCAPLVESINLISQKSLWRKAIVRNSSLTLERLIALLESRIPQQNRVAAAAGPACLQTLLDERALVYKKMLDPTPLKLALEDSSFPTESHGSVKRSISRLEELCALAAK